MSEKRVLSIYRTLKEISTFTKNIIVNKSNIRGKDRVHISSIQPILERRIGRPLDLDHFFNHNKSIVIQFLKYLSSCGEIIHLGGGYYTVLPERYVRLPVSQSLIKVGDLKSNEEGSFKLGLLDGVDNRKNFNIMSLSDYRFDINLNDWMKIIEYSDKSVQLFYEEYYRPTMRGLIRIKLGQSLSEGELYYIISRPFESKKEYFIAKKTNGNWKGEMINKNFLKSKLALLTSRGYSPTYKIKQLGESILKITLSDFLPSVERDQAYLFSLPRQLKHNNTYYIRKEHLQDFIYILKSLEFKERNEKL